MHPTPVPTHPMSKSMNDIARYYDHTCQLQLPLPFKTPFPQYYFGTPPSQKVTSNVLYRDFFLKRNSQFYNYLRSF